VLPSSSNGAVCGIPITLQAFCAYKQLAITPYLRRAFWLRKRGWFVRSVLHKRQDIFALRGCDGATAPPIPTSSGCRVGPLHHLSGRSANWRGSSEFLALAQDWSLSRASPARGAHLVAFDPRIRGRLWMQRASSQNRRSISSSRAWGMGARWLIAPSISILGSYSSRSRCPSAGVSREVTACR
jgi:hypothetical protein